MNPWRKKKRIVRRALKTYGLSNLVKIQIEVMESLFAIV